MAEPVVEKLPDIFNLDKFELGVVTSVFRNHVPTCVVLESLDEGRLIKIFFEEVVVRVIRRSTNRRTARPIAFLCHP